MVLQNGEACCGLELFVINLHKHFFAKFLSSLDLLTFLLCHFKYLLFFLLRNVFSKLFDIFFEFISLSLEIVVLLYGLLKGGDFRFLFLEISFIFFDHH